MHFACFFYKQAALACATHPNIIICYSLEYCNEWADNDLLKESSDGDLNKQNKQLKRVPTLKPKGEDDEEMLLHIASLHGHESIISLLLKMCIMI